jgi:hypothetical protein
MGAPDAADRGPASESGSDAATDIHDVVDPFEAAADDDEAPDAGAAGPSDAGSARPTGPGQGGSDPDAQ